MSDERQLQVTLSHMIETTKYKYNTIKMQLYTKEPTKKNKSHTEKS